MGYNPAGAAPPNHLARADTAIRRLAPHAIDGTSPAAIILRLSLYEMPMRRENSRGLIV
jgi:hypothetical protein